MGQMVQDIEAFAHKEFSLLGPFFNEKVTRVWAGAMALQLCYGGIATVVRITGLARKTVRAGMDDVQDPAVRQSDRVRRPGGGRKSVVAGDPTLLDDLRALVAPATRGDPERTLRWTSKSVAKITAELQAQDHTVTVSERTVSKLLKAEGYSLQSLRKVHEGTTDHPDRDLQFKFIADQSARFQEAGDPAISVDTKKKELIGNFQLQNKGQQWQPKGQPETVNVYDFPSDAEGKAVPYGVYDVTANEGFVNVGMSHDTAEFSVASIRQWWETMGQARYPATTRLYITKR